MLCLFDFCTCTLTRPPTPIMLFVKCWGLFKNFRFRNYHYYYLLCKELVYHLIITALISLQKLQCNSGISFITVFLFCFSVWHLHTKLTLFLHYKQNRDFFYITNKTEVYFVLALKIMFPSFIVVAALFYYLGINMSQLFPIFIIL